MAYPDLHDTDHVIKFKSGLEASVNVDATKNMATQGEPHWATDSKLLYVFDGSQNVLANPPIIVDTKDTILALTPVNPTLAYASDVDRFYIWDGGDWMQGAIEYVANAETPDMGMEQDSSLQGYGLDYVDGKVLTHVKLGDAANDETGALRYSVVDSSFQVYSGGTWNDVVIGFRLREDDDEIEFEHNPIGYELWYEIMSGNSDVIGIDGRPLVQQYKSSMGPYQRDLIVDGGTF